MGDSCLPPREGQEPGGEIEGFGFGFFFELLFLILGSDVAKWGMWGEHSGQVPREVSLLKTAMGVQSPSPIGLLLSAASW